jgi:hypothetical protein
MLVNTRHGKANLIKVIQDKEGNTEIVLELVQND